jgi:hypothetical protein
VIFAPLLNAGGVQVSAIPLSIEFAVKLSGAEGISFGVPEASVEFVPFPTVVYAMIL